MKNTTRALTRAVTICKSQHGLARAINKRLIHKSINRVKQQNIYNWLQGARIPAEYCIPIEEATESAVKAIQLRPDVFKLDYTVTK